MAWYDWGNTPLNSTALPATNPSTSALIAEIDSTQTAAVTAWSTATGTGGRMVPGRLTCILGASTIAEWRVEASLSSTLADDVYFRAPSIRTPTEQSGQYVFNVPIEPGARCRVRLASTFTGNASAFLQWEPLT